MTEKVDDGNIVECRRFPIHENDTVNSLLERTYVKLLDLFFDVISGITVNRKSYIDKSIKNSISENGQVSKRKIKDLDNLSILDVNVTKNKLENLIRATYKENFPPNVILYGYEFFLKLNTKK